MVVVKPPVTSGHKSPHSGPFIIKAQGSGTGCCRRRASMHSSTASSLDAASMAADMITYTAVVRGGHLQLSWNQYCRHLIMVRYVPIELPDPLPDQDLKQPDLDAFVTPVEQVDCRCPSVHAPLMLIACGSCRSPTPRGHRWYASGRCDSIPEWFRVGQGGRHPLSHTPCMTSTETGADAGVIVPATHCTPLIHVHMRFTPVVKRRR